MSLDRYASPEIPKDVAGFKVLWAEIEASKARSAAEWREWMRAYSANSLWFFMRYVLSCQKVLSPISGKPELEHPFVFGYVNEIQADWDGVLDLGARGHWKSTTKTFALPIWLLVREPNEGIALVSCEIDIAEAHSKRIKQELEENEKAKLVWDDVFYENPDQESPVWTKRKLRVKRTANRLEESIEANGFDEMHTGKHYSIQLLDDCVNERWADNEAQRAKAIQRHSSILNLVSRFPRRSYTGTPYHAGDLYAHLESNNMVRVRKRPAEDLSKPPPAGYEDLLSGEPVFLTAEELLDKRKMGVGWYAKQYLCDPFMAEDQRLDPALFRRYSTDPWKERVGKNIYVLVDPGGRGGGKQTGDPTAIVVVGLGYDRNIYVLDIISKQLNPRERILEAFRLYRQYMPVIEFRWEEVGVSNDTFYIEERQNETGIRFPVTRVTRSGRYAKEKTARIYDQIAQPLLQNRIYLPQRLYKKDPATGAQVCQVERFINVEVLPFPLGREDHILDALTLLFEDPERYGELIFPMFNASRRAEAEDGEYDDDEGEGGGSWMTA